MSFTRHPSALPGSDGFTLSPPSCTAFISTRGVLHPRSSRLAPAAVWATALIYADGRSLGDFCPKSARAARRGGRGGIGVDAGRVSRKSAVSSMAERLGRRALRRDQAGGAQIPVRRRRLRGARGVARGRNTVPRLSRYCVHGDQSAHVRTVPKHVHPRSPT